jgi:hypothetical protein
MFRTVLVVGALSVGLWVASARAGTPFGGDDIGSFIPPDVGSAKCEAAAAKILLSITQHTLKAHNKIAKGGGATGATDEGEAGPQAGRIAPVIARIYQSGFICNEAVACIEHAFLLLGSPSRTDDQGWSPINAAIYCDTSSGTPFGGDDTGFIPPPNSAIKNCEIKVGKAEIKLATCYLNCAALRASGTLSDEAAEEACESTCTSTFTGLVAGLTGCPSCLDSGAIATMTESLIDGTYVPAAYCASPSGAFVR